jgi:hypothetical protein
MNINLLLKHEDVYKKISNSLLEHKFISSWSRVSMLQSFFYSQEVYVSLPRLNVIVLPSSLKLLEAFLLNRYKSKNLLFRLVQRAYIKLSCNFFIFSILASDERFKITWNHQGVYTILGGSSYTKIISHLDSRLISILKNSYGIFDFEINFRLGASEPIGQLPLLKVDRRGSYIEPFYKDSTGINGDNYIQDYKTILDAVELYMRALHSENFIRISVNTYKCFYYTQLHQYLNKADSVIFQFVSLLFGRVSNFESIDYSITHGDLQLCNIIMNDEDVYIIDWESLGFRATIYDEVILYSSSRGNLHQIDDFIGTPTHSEGVFISYLSWKYGERTLDYLYIYYLEEVLFRLTHSKEGACSVEKWAKYILSKIYAA